MNNMEIWEAVSKTDPAHTKRVNQRGGFTAIDAQYQIMMATKQFGPIGIGWGYDAGMPVFEGGCVIIPVTVWHGTRENTFGPVYGCKEMFGARTDDDAPKKATTDGLTKALSLLGFNADVFLGKFDDNKYIAQRQQEERNAATAGLANAWEDAIYDALPEEPSEQAVAEAFAETMRSDIDRYKSVDGINGYLVKHKKHLNFLEQKLPEAFSALKSHIENQREQLKPEAA